MIGKALHRGLEQEDVSALIEAHDWLCSLADRDCDCTWSDDRTQIDNPCEICQAKRALDALNRVIDPRPRTLHPERLKNYSERIYFELWCEENKRQVGLNGGFTLIEHLLCPETARRHPLSGHAQPGPVTQHDMTIATTVIQWLGTNCGRCFMQKAESEIDKRRGERDSFMTHGIGQTPKAWKERDENGPLWSVADSIAAQFISIEKNRSAYTALQLAIHNALCEVSKQPVATA